MKIMKAALYTGIFAGLALSAQALWVPEGTVYAAPKGGTLVLDEEYGSTHAGAGTWGKAQGAAAVTVNEDDIVISLKGDGEVSPLIDLPLPFRPADADYVIDVGLKEWTTKTGGNQWNSLWWIQSKYGAYTGGESKRIMHNWVAKKNTIEGRYTSDSIKFQQGTGYVLRFTGKAGDYSPDLITNLGADGISEESHSAAGENLNFLRLYCSKAGDSLNRIAWIKIYTGVSTAEAPLVNRDAGDVVGDVKKDVLPKETTAGQFAMCSNGG